MKIKEGNYYGINITLMKKKIFLKESCGIGVSVPKPLFQQISKKKNKDSGYGVDIKLMNEKYIALKKKFGIKISVPKFLFQNLFRKIKHINK